MSRLGTKAESDEAQLRLRSNCFPTCPAGSKTPHEVLLVCELGGGKCGTAGPKTPICRLTGESSPANQGGVINGFMLTKRHIRFIRYGTTQDPEDRSHTDHFLSLNPVEPNRFLLHAVNI